MCWERQWFIVVALRTPSITRVCLCLWQRARSVCMCVRMCVCRMLKNLFYCCRWTRNISINSITTLYILWPSYLQPFAWGGEGEVFYTKWSPHIESLCEQISLSDIGTMQIIRPLRSYTVLSAVLCRFKTWERRVRWRWVESDRKLNGCEGSGTIPARPSGFCFTRQ